MTKTNKTVSSPLWVYAIGWLLLSTFVFLVQIIASIVLYNIPRDTVRAYLAFVYPWPAVSLALFDNPLVNANAPFVVAMIFAALQWFLYAILVRLARHHSFGRMSVWIGLCTLHVSGIVLHGAVK